MRNFQDVFETQKQPFIRGFSICMTASLTVSFKNKVYKAVLVIPWAPIYWAREKLVMCCNDENLKFSEINTMQTTWSVVLQNSLCAIIVWD